jgi:hypothetical protein
MLNHRKVRKVLTGFHEYDVLQATATRAYFAGTPKEAPENQLVSLPPADSTYRSEIVWKQQLTDIIYLTAANPDSDGSMDGSAVDGAHWIDLDGNGTDEMIAGYNGGGGLHAACDQGKKLWQITKVCNVWIQSAVSVPAPEYALIFATDATGSIRTIDASGNARSKSGRVVTIAGPGCKYFTALNQAQEKGMLVTFANGQVKCSWLELVR